MMHVWLEASVAAGSTQGVTTLCFVVFLFDSASYPRTDNSMGAFVTWSVYSTLQSPNSSHRFEMQVDTSCKLQALRHDRTMWPETEMRDGDDKVTHSVNRDE